MKIPTQLIARDGAAIGVHMTPAVGAERGLLIFQNGTAAGAEMFDGMAAKLAERGITSVTIADAPHDLSQQWQDPAVVDTISDFVLTRGVA